MTWKRLSIQPDASVKDALKQLDNTAEKTLFVVNDEGVYLGAITDGDIRRHLISGGGLDEKVAPIYNSRSYFIRAGDFEIDAVRKKMTELRILVVPVLGNKQEIIDLIFFNDVIGQNQTGNFFSTQSIETPVVIMAGGKGTRMAPFTQVLPKPLIPIGDKTILEIIMESFERFHVTEFFFTLNYRGEMIKAYFDSIEKQRDINYLWEKEFCGTAGSLELLPLNIAETFIVSNCDIIVKADYAEVVKFHHDSQADLTIIASIQHHVIPYGVVEYGNLGVVHGIKEKPEFSFPINTGVYVVNKSCLEFIPQGSVFHMTDMIEELIAKGRKVVTYLVNEQDYIDVGQWGEYNKALDKMRGFS